MSLLDCKRLSSLITALNSCDVVLVEGVNDVLALQSFGVSHIMRVKGVPLFKIVEEIPRGSRVAILTDLDAEGKKLYAVLNDAFSQRGVFVDNKLREFLFKHTSLRQVEGLRRFVERRCLTFFDY